MLQYEYLRLFLWIILQILFNLVQQLLPPTKCPKNGIKVVSAYAHKVRSVLSANILHSSSFPHAKVEVKGWLATTELLLLNKNVVSLVNVMIAANS